MDFCILLMNISPEPRALSDTEASWWSDDWGGRKKGKSCPLQDIFSDKKSLTLLRSQARSGSRSQGARPETPFHRENWGLSSSHVYMCPAAPKSLAGVGVGVVPAGGGSRKARRAHGAGRRCQAFRRCTQAKASGLPSATLFLSLPSHEPDSGA